MATESQYNVIKVNELTELEVAVGSDEMIINDVDSFPLETKKITAENFAYSIKDYILPIASADVLGGIKVGPGLTINPISGVLEADVQHLDDLQDVTVVNPSNDQILIYNGDQWINSDLGGLTEIVAGAGLSGGGVDGVITLHVNPGQGISIKQDTVSVNINQGLSLSNNYINVNIGTGIGLSNNSLIAKIGQGLEFVGGNITASLGRGLEFSNNQIQTTDVVGKGTLAIKANGVTQGTFNANQDQDSEVNIEIPEVLDFTPTKAAFLEVVIDAGSTHQVCIDNKLLVLSADAVATTATGESAIGRFRYQWKENGNPLQNTRSELLGGTSTSDLYIEDFDIIPQSGTRTFEIEVTFIDLFNEEMTASAQCVVSFAQALTFGDPPTGLDLSEDTNGIIKVNVEQMSSELPAVSPNYKWYINNVEITSATTPDVGYTFSGFSTDTLDINRISGNAGTYNIECHVVGGCQEGEMITPSVLLKGPEPENVEIPTPVFPLDGQIGSYRIFRGGYATGVGVLPGGSLTISGGRWNPTSYFIGIELYSQAGFNRQQQRPMVYTLAQRIA